MQIRDSGHASGTGGDATGAESRAVVPEFLTVRELAKLLRVGRNQAYALVNSGQIVSYRLGGSIRVPRAALDRLAAGAPALPLLAVVKGDGPTSPERRPRALELEAAPPAATETKEA